MSRHARITDINGIYHIVIKQSNSKPLFPSEDDKKIFLKKVLESKIKYQFYIYSYCLMDTHVHFILDSNGKNISDIMKSINLRYSKYYNHQYNTNGPLLKERFFSELITSDQYLLKASLYIHANPKDILSYNLKPESYKYSSMRFYLGEKDELEIINTNFILSVLSKNIKYAIESYIQLFEHTLKQKCKHFKFLDISIPIKIHNKQINLKLDDKEFDSTREILERNFEVEQIIQFVEKETGLLRSSFLTKSNHGVKTPKALFVLLLGIYTQKNTYEIGAILEGMSISQVNKLSNEGINLVLNDEIYKHIIENFYLKSKQKNF